MDLDSYDEDDFIEVPIFVGNNLSDWIEKMETIMELIEVPTIQRVNFAYVYVEGDARDWVRSHLDQVNWWSWEQFTTAIGIQFGEFSIHCEAVKTLCYVDEKDLALWVPELGEDSKSSSIPELLSIDVDQKALGKRDSREVNNKTDSKWATMKMGDAASEEEDRESLVKKIYSTAYTRFSFEEGTLFCPKLFPFDPGCSNLRLTFSSSLFDSSWNYEDLVRITEEHESHYDAADKSIHGRDKKRLLYGHLGHPRKMFEKMFRGDVFNSVRVLLTVVHYSYFGCVVDGLHRKTLLYFIVSEHLRIWINVVPGYTSGIVMSIALNLMAVYASPGSFLTCVQECQGRHFSMEYLCASKTYKGA